MDHPPGQLHQLIGQDHSQQQELPRFKKPPGFQQQPRVTHVQGPCQPSGKRLPLRRDGFVVEKALGAVAFGTAPLEQAVQAQGLTFPAYRENLRKQILRYKLVGQEVRSRVDVSESEVRDYYRAHLEEYRLPPTVTLSTLSFPVPEKAGTVERESIRTAANEALGRLRAGESLEQVAAAYRDNYGAAGSSLASIAEGELTPEFSKALAGVEKGGFGALAETDRAIVLLKVDDRTTSGLRQFEAVRPEITQILHDQKTDGRIKEWTQTLKQKSFIDIRL